MRALAIQALFLISSGLATAGETPGIQSEFVFPMRSEHNHAPGIVECPNGDLLASWYRGSGERRSDDVAVFGARLKKGEQTWGETFLIADNPEFPDCNTTMMIDRHQKLWVFWPVIIDNNWESALTNFRVSSDYMSDGAPKWERDGVIYLKPYDFKADAIKHLEDELAQAPPAIQEYFKRRDGYFDEFKKRLDSKLYQRLGWQPRCKPTVLPSGRILLPLYSDTFSVGLMAISDDDGQHWYSGKPMMGFGAIQPTVLRRNDGMLVAYSRENGPKKKIRVCESTDEGMSWGPTTEIDLPNPGAGIDAVRLENGHWCLIYNDATRGRNTLAVSISEDEGKSWKYTRHLEKHEKGAYHYPAMIQGKDGTIHAIYSYFSPDAMGPGKEGKTMKHAAFNEAWIVEGDAKE